MRRFYPDPVVAFSVLLLTTLGFLNTLSVKLPAFVFHGFDLQDLRKPFLMLLFSLIGFLLMSATAFFLDYRRLNNQRLVYSLVILSLLLLILVFVKKIVLGKAVERWLIGTSVQPSELSKLVIILFISYYVARKGAPIGGKFLGWAVLVAVVHSFLLFLQPDKGMALFVLLLAWSMLWIGGASPKIYIPLGAVFSLLGILFLTVGGDYVHRRLSAWQNPLQDYYGTGYQVVQAMLALINGGFLGQGSGKGLQKFGALSQADTDYALANVGEELGFPGILFLLTLYAVLTWRLVRIAVQVVDVFGKLLVAGVTLSILFSTVTNVMMAVNILPPKGIPLPFVSYGISNFLMNFLALGLVGAVYKRQPYRTVI